MPSLKAAGKRANALKSAAAQLKGYTRARQFVRSITVKDNFAITRDWRSVGETIVLRKPVGVDAYRAGNALVASQSIAAVM